MAVASSESRTFVVRVEKGAVHWVDVQRGFTDGQQVEIFGKLHAGDLLVKKATDELQEGTRVRVKPAQPSEDEKQQPKKK
jgi:hypothetical protein